MNLNKTIKKNALKLMIAGLTTTTFAGVLTTNLPLVASAQEQSKATDDFNYGEVMDFGYIKVTPKYPKSILPGEEGTVTFDISWDKPSDASVFGINGNISNGLFTEIPKGDIFDEGLRTRIINGDAYGQNTSFSMTFKAGTFENGVVKVSGDFDFVGEDFQEHPINYSFEIPVTDVVLENAKKEAKETINGLGNLTNTEKTEFNTQINSATTVEAVKAIEEAAKIKDQENALTKAKEEAKNTVNNLPNLLENEKTEFNTQIDSATTVEAVKAIEEAAKELNNKFNVGDINGDGKISLTDYALLQIYLQKDIVPEGLTKEEFVRRADLTKDSKVTLGDYAKLQKLLLNTKN